MDHYAVIANGASVVSSTVEWDGVSPWSPPEGFSLVADPTRLVAPGWGYVNGEFIAPVVEPPVPVPQYIPTAIVLSRLTLEEYTAIKQAAAAQLQAGNGQLELWLDTARVSINGINPSDPATLAAIAALTSGTPPLLTADRAAVVFSVS